jgi:hypothetical protein
MTVCTVDEAEDRYERVLIASLCAVGNLSLVLAASNGKEKEKEKESEDRINSASNSSGNTTSEEVVEIALQGFKDIFNDKFWGSIAMHRIISIRRAAYETITAVCNSIPAAIYSTQSPTQNSNHTDSGPQKPESRSSTIFGLNKISAAFCQILSEKNQSNIPSMILAFLSFAKNFPLCWNHLIIDQVFVSRLKSLLNESPKCTLEHLLPIFGAIPSDLIAIFASGVTHVSTVLYCAVMYDTVCTVL